MCIEIKNKKSIDKQKNICYNVNSKNQSTKY